MEAEEQDNSMLQEGHNFQLGFRFPDLPTTVDPAHVVRLIRQLLPSHGNPDVLLREIGYNPSPLPTVERNGALRDGGKNGVEENAYDTGTSAPSRSAEPECRGEKNSRVEEAVSHVHAGTVEPAVRGASEERTACHASGAPGIRAERKLEEVEAKEGDEREQVGCVLWDLAALESHARFMMDNYILDVVTATLVHTTQAATRTPSLGGNGSLQDFRMKEIALGILGNLACHPFAVASMASHPGLVSAVVAQLFCDDPPTLTEACRLLCACLHNGTRAGKEQRGTSTGAEGAARGGDGSSSKEQRSGSICCYCMWASALEEESVLGRVMWIAENTTQTQLQEKCVELLLALVESEEDVSVEAEAEERDQAEGAEGQQQQQLGVQQREAGVGEREGGAGERDRRDEEGGEAKVWRDLALLASCLCGPTDATGGPKRTVPRALPSLLRLGLPVTLTTLLESEVAALTSTDEPGEDKSPDLLDSLLRIAEALSLSDQSAADLARDPHLFSLTTTVLRTSARAELGTAPVTATVLLANLLAEDPGLVDALGADPPLLRSLLLLLPSVADDPGARSALWSILSRTFRQVARGQPPGNGAQERYVRQLLEVGEAIAEGVDYVLEDCEEHWGEDEEQEEEEEEEEEEAEQGAGLRRDETTSGSDKKMPARSGSPGPAGSLGRTAEGNSGGAQEEDLGNGLPWTRVLNSSESLPPRLEAAAHMARVMDMALDCMHLCRSRGYSQAGEGSCSSGEDRLRSAGMRLCRLLSRQRARGRSSSSTSKRVATVAAGGDAVRGGRRGREAAGTGDGRDCQHSEKLEGNDRKFQVYLEQGG